MTTTPERTGEEQERRRPFLLALLLVVLTVAVVVDQRVERASRVETDEAWAPGMPVAAPESALATAWYCAGGTAAPDGVADAGVTLANAGSRPATGRITIFGVGVESRQIPVTVPPAERVAVRYQDVLQAPFAAALVELDSGAVAAEHAVAGPHGMEVSPCASAPSSTWHFADGSTARDDLMLLALFNPFPDDAIVDMTFATEQGHAEPADFQGIVVAARSLVVVNVGDHVRRRDSVAATVSARRGRLVIDRVQARGGEARRGLALVVGAPAPAPVWYFPDGVVADGIAERFHVYNPTRREAVVDVDVNLDEGSIEPFEVRVPPRDRVSLVLGDESRVPRGVGYSAVVRSVNGVDVVAERTSDAGSPAPRAGSSDMSGSTRRASRWLFPAGSASDTLDEWVTVLNPSTRDVTVSVTALAAGQRVPIEGLQDVAVPRGRRAFFRLTDHIKRDDLAVLVSATGEVVVQRDLFAAGSPGLSRSIGVPLAD